MNAPNPNDNNPNQKLPHKRKLKGTVVSVSSNKTAVVKFSWIKIHPQYKKRINWSKKYHVHDEKNSAKLGDYVEFVECRPISKLKHFRLSKIIN